VVYNAMKTFVVEQAGIKEELTSQLSVVETDTCAERHLACCA